ncbi:MAG: GAF domain-containing protein [Verrucomicrobiae bacterium]|nr:GAF domain-containing protein [Verrucomicrobiae bacterium]
MRVPASDHGSEVSRLEELASYQILDTLPEPPFDDLVRLAARACRVPVAYLGFVDERREWFKARLGISISETPRRCAVSEAARRDEKVTVIHDAQNDPRLAGNPLLCAVPQLRFFAGAPLRTPTGKILGAVTVGDVRPHRFGRAERDALTCVARLIMQELEIRRQILTLQESVALLSGLRPPHQATSHGLLSICAGCKRIRQGQHWISVTHYFEQHADVAFVHGVCPDCLATVEARPRRTNHLQP